MATTLTDITCCDLASTPAFVIKMRLTLLHLSMAVRTRGWPEHQHGELTGLVLFLLMIEWVKEGT